MKFRRAMSFLLALVLSMGMMSMVCLPAAAAANPVFIINPNGTAGSQGTVAGQTGTVYKTYADFEADYDGTGADVYFMNGFNYDPITVTKKVNLYGAKKGVDPNVKGSDILADWSLNGNRNSGETVLCAPIEIKTKGAGNDVLIDGFTLKDEAKIWVSCSKEDLDVTIQNIVVNKNITATDYFIWASPELKNVGIPATDDYKMTFTLKNVYADDFNESEGSFIRYIAAKNVLLDNIYYANTTTMFLMTTASNKGENTFKMQNSFINQVQPDYIAHTITGAKAVIYHDYPSPLATAPSVTYTNNVFLNAHGVEAHTIYFDRLCTTNDKRIVTDNTFITEYGAFAPVRFVDRSYKDNANGYDVANNMSFKRNSVVGYVYTVDHIDNRFENPNFSGIETYTGTLDLSENFSYLVDETSATKINSGLTIAKCKELEGSQARTNGKGMQADVSGLYYKDFKEDYTTGTNQTSEVYIINTAVESDASNGNIVTFNGSGGKKYTGKWYNSYAAFEAAYTPTADHVADVYFTAGSKLADITITKKANLHGFKYGVDPNVKNEEDILHPWTLNGSRAPGKEDTKITGLITIDVASAGHDVLIDGFKVTEKGQIWIKSSEKDIDVTIQNIVVDDSANPQDYFICAAPKYADGEIPNDGTYNMTFNLKNVYAKDYKGTGAFIRYIAAQKAVLDNIYYADTSTMFLQTTAVSKADKSEFIMQNSFLYNNIPTTNPINPFHQRPKTTIYHDNHTDRVKDPSITYTNNVFYNAHGENGYTIFAYRLNALNDERVFKNNTFVTDVGAVAPISPVNNTQAASAGYDFSKIVISKNRIVGYNYAVLGDISQTYTGKVDLSDNFTWIPSGTEGELDLSTTDKCRELIGMPPKSSGDIPVNIAGAYYKDFDLTIKSSAYIIDPDATGNNGDVVTLGNGIGGILYKSYAAFEAAYTGAVTPDVYFDAGEFADGFEITKKVNLYGYNYGIDPNVKDTDILKPWTLNSKRNSNETVFKGKIKIAASVTGDVLLDGFTFDGAGQIFVGCSAKDCDVTIRNIVVGTDATTDYFICASPKGEASPTDPFPSTTEYKMTFHLSNVYATAYNDNARAFIYYIIAQHAELTNIYYANSKTMFLHTSASATNKNEFIMKDSFLYNINSTKTLTGDSLSGYSKKAALFHDNPSSGVVDPSIEYTNNVFYNVYGTDGFAIYCRRLNAENDERTFVGNTFVTTTPKTAPVQLVQYFNNDKVTYNLSKIKFTENRVIGYDFTVSAESSNSYYSGKIDVSDNFTAAFNENKEDMVGNAPTATGSLATNNVNVSGPYYLDFDLTKSSDMLRIVGVEGLANASVNGTAITGIMTQDNYTPKFIFSCGNDIERTITIKNASGTTVNAISSSGTYTVTVGYDGKTSQYTLEVTKATAYAGAGYLFDPAAAKGVDAAYYWDGTAQVFTFGVNLFNDLTKLFIKADADKVDVPQILLPAQDYVGDYQISHSCEILGYKYGKNPIEREADPTKPDTLSTERGTNETNITGKWIINYTEDNMTYIFDGITLKGDGRIGDNGNGKAGLTTTFKNIICSEGALSASTKENARFSTKSYSEKALTFENIWMDGLAASSATGVTEEQIFYFTGSDIVLDNIYLANTVNTSSVDLKMCANVFLQSGNNHTRDLSMTVTGCKFYNIDAARWFKFTGTESGAYRKYANRNNVAINFENNLFYNCADWSNSNPNGNAVVVFEYPYPCFKYQFTNNTFVDDREVYHFLNDASGKPLAYEKRLGTDVYTQFLHFVPKNHRVDEVNYQSDLTNNIKITENRFVGRNTIINSENDLFNGSIELEKNFFVSYETVQSVKNTTNWIGSIKGENPNRVMNVRNTKNGVESYYLDYAKETTAMDRGPSIGRVDRVNQIVEITKTSYSLGIADLKIDGKTKPGIYRDAACNERVTKAIDCTQKEGTLVYYLNYGDADEKGDKLLYTLILHTATTEATYSKEAKLYDPLAKGLPAGIKWYRQIDGVLYAFETGKNVFGDMDEIAVHTQTESVDVLLPARNYTTEELQTVESVTYIFDTNATLNGAPITEDTTVAKKKDKIKVICLGDSITLGTGVSGTGISRATHAYPAQLQQVLDANHPEDYEVINYGRGGSLGANVSAYGYETLWNYSLALKENPDIVILAFGANDAVYTSHGRVAVEHFKEEMLEMIAEFKALPSKPIIYITTTTNVTLSSADKKIDDGRRERPQKFLNELRQIQRETAIEANVHLLDAYKLSVGWIAEETTDTVAGETVIYNKQGEGDTVHFNQIGYQKMARDYYNNAENGMYNNTDDKTLHIDWTEQGAHQPGDDEVTITFKLGKVAEVNGKIYSDLKSALKDASLEAAGQREVTVKLHKNLTRGNDIQDHIVVDTFVKLDLNGNQIQANYVVGFKSSGIYDSSTDKTGRLFAEKDCVSMSTKNIDAGSIDYLPVYDDENGCYLFTNVKYTNIETGGKRYSWKRDGDVGVFMFSPKFLNAIKDYAINTEAHEQLLKGAEKSGVKVALRLTWTEKGDDNKGYTATQTFIYNDKFVETVINSFGKKYATDYEKVFKATLRRNDEDTVADSYKISAVIISETGVEYATPAVDFGV